MHNNMSMMQKLRCTRFPLLAIFSLICSVGLAFPASAASARYITVSDTGITTVVPDAVRVIATVSVLGTSSKDALSIAAATATDMRSVFTSNKVSAKDVSTQSLTVYPEYSYSASSSPTILGYRASQSFDIIIRKATSAGAIVEAIVEAGADNLQVNSVSPFVLDYNKATEIARAFAVKKARIKATSYARYLGVKLGRVIYLEETTTSPSFPIYTSAAKSDSVGAIVDLGEQKVSVSVVVRWAIG